MARPLPSCRECLDEGLQFRDEGPSNIWCVGDPGSLEEDGINGHTNSKFNDKIYTINTMSTTMMIKMRLTTSLIAMMMRVMGITHQILMISIWK